MLNKIKSFNNFIDFIGFMFILYLNKFIHKNNYNDQIHFLLTSAINDKKIKKIKQILKIYPKIDLNQNRYYQIPILSMPYFLDISLKNKPKIANKVNISILATAMHSFDKEILNYLVEKGLDLNKNFYYNKRNTNMFTYLNSKELNLEALNFFKELKLDLKKCFKKNKYHLSLPFFLITSKKEDLFRWYIQNDGPINQFDDDNTWLLKYYLIFITNLSNKNTEMFFENKTWSFNDKKDDDTYLWKELPSILNFFNETVQIEYLKKLELYDKINIETFHLIDKKGESLAFELYQHNIQDKVFYYILSKGLDYHIKLNNDIEFKTLIISSKNYPLSKDFIKKNELLKILELN